LVPQNTLKKTLGTSIMRRLLHSLASADCCNRKCSCTSFPRWGSPDNHSTVLNKLLLPSLHCIMAGSKSSRPLLAKKQTI